MPKVLLDCQESNIPDRHRIAASREPAKNASRRKFKNRTFALYICSYCFWIALIFALRAQIACGIKQFFFTVAFVSDVTMSKFFLRSMSILF